MKEMAEKMENVAEDDVLVADEVVDMDAVGSVVRNGDIHKRNKRRWW